MTTIFWVSMNKLEFNNFFKKIIKLENQKIIFTPNPEMLLKAEEDKRFKQILLSADYLIPDWTGLFIAYQILDQKYKLLSILLIPYYFFNFFFNKRWLYKKYWEKICWSDLTLDLVIFAENNWVKITIIDSYSSKTDKKTIYQTQFEQIMKKKFPKLKFDYFVYNPSKKSEIINHIKKSDSKILFSTLWTKKQESSVIEILWKCKNLKLWLAVWSSFDYFTWFQKRSPLFLRRLWLEWLYRLLVWHKRLNRLKRLFNAIFVFLYKVIKSK